jgi:hypothetical protein
MVPYLSTGVEVLRVILKHSPPPLVPALYETLASLLDAAATAADDADLMQVVQFFCVCRSFLFIWSTAECRRLFAHVFAERSGRPLRLELSWPQWP